VNSRDISLWFADGSNYPGTANIRQRRQWFREGLRGAHGALAPNQRLLVEYKPFEPAFYHTDIVQAVILWNTRDLGYLTVLSAAQLTRQAFAAGATSIDAGRLGKLDVRGSEIVLGAPLLMNKGNIDKYDF
jgi:L-rhamnose isomerase